MIETHVGDDGRVIDYEIISGQQDPEVDKWVSELLYFAQFTPATAFGKPVDSRIILSFVAVVRSGADQAGNCIDNTVGDFSVLRAGAVAIRNFLGFSTASTRHPSVAASSC